MPMPTIRSQSNAEYIDGATRPLVFTLPATVEAGDLLVLFVWDSTGTGAVTGPSGWAAAIENSPATTQPRVYVYNKVAAGTEDGTTVTVGYGHPSMSIQMLCLALNGAAAHAAVAFVRATPTLYSTSNQSTSSVCPSVNATVGDSLVLRLIYGGGASVGTCTNPGGTTQIFNDTCDNGSPLFVRVVAQNAAQAVGATGTATFGSFTTWHRRYADTLVIGSSAVAPVVTDVSLSGTSQIGHTLTATATTAPASVDSKAYRWQKAEDGSGTGAATISGETAQTLALSYTDFADLLDSDPNSVYVRCGVIATIGAENSTEVFSSWQAVTVASGGGFSGSPLKSPFLIS